MEDKPSEKHNTAWHPLFIRALRRGLPNEYFDVSGELQINQQPLRVDTVVIRKKALPPGFRATVLVEPIDLLGEYTIVELKGTTDVLACASRARSSWRRSAG